MQEHNNLKIDASIAKIKAEYPSQAMVIKIIHKRAVVMEAAYAGQHGSYSPDGHFFRTEIKGFFKHKIVYHYPETPGELHVLGLGQIKGI